MLFSALMARTRLLGTVSAGLFLLSAGCSATPQSTTNASAEASSDSCAEYETRLCDEAGPESETCIAAQKTLALLPPKACAEGVADLEHAYQRIRSQKASCSDLVNRLCKDLGPETQTCMMVQSQTPMMSAENCTQMNSEYPEVIAELQRMESRNKPLETEIVKMIADGDGPSFGSKTAGVTIVEFSDFQCPYCERAASATHAIQEKYGDSARLVFRQYPLSFHQNAHLAAQASLAAHAQGKFWAYHDLLFANQQDLDRPNLEQYAADAGLDLVLFRKALDEQTFKDAVDKDIALGERAAVDGTPTMFIDGQRIADPTDFASIAKAIDARLHSAD